MSSSKKPILQLVVGVHRSGTSVSTQVLSVLGLDLGRTLMLPAFDNPRGFWENSKVVDVHDRLLSSLGLDWTTAAGLPSTWVESDAADIAIKELVEVLTTDFDENSNKLVKDPRLAVLLPLWPHVAQALGHELHVLGALRRPLKTKESIAKRNGFSDPVVDLIVSSQLKSLKTVLSPFQPPVVIFERLTSLDADEIVHDMTKTLPHLRIDATAGMVDLVGRIVGKRRHDSGNDTDQYSVFMKNAKPTLFVEWNAASDFLETVQCDEAQLKGTSSFIPKLSKTIPVPDHRLRALQEAEEQNVKLVADYKRLESEFNEKAEALKEYVNKVEVIQKSVSEERDRGNALGGGIEERDLRINDLLLQIKSFESLEQLVADRDSQLTSLSQEIVEFEEEKSRLIQKMERLESDLRSQRQASDAAKVQRDSLNLKIRESELVINTAQKVEGELQSKLSEANENLELSRLEQAKLDKEMSKLVRTIKASKTRHQKKLADKDAELGRLNAAVVEVKANLNEAQLMQRDLEKQLVEKTDLLEDKQRILNIRGAELYESQQALSGTQSQLAEITRIKEMQDTTIEMESLRSKMVEDEYASKFAVLENRLNYFEKAPLRAGLKSFLFSTLRFIRRGLPLPEMIKLRLARKMTGLAQRLQPPVNQIEFSDLSYKTNDTIDFGFQEVDKPVISIIVPVYNEISQTIACLKSIYQQRVSVPYEVIIADDASPDPFHKILKDIPGVKYIRQPQNLHFLLNCNRAAEQARGEYLIFLNNDTLVKPGWMENLLATFREHGNVGIVGSKLVYPSGELQEAGGVIWEDASGWNWGKGQNADHPLYNFVRDVDYVSGASLMIPSSLWREIGGFYEGLEKAYYEDADLCFKVRDMGYRVMYQPASVVIHIEGLTSGTDLNAGAKQYQLVNQNIFKDRWSEKLKHHLPNAETPLVASDRVVKGHVLYIDAETPEPDKDAGSVNSVYAMRILVEQGYRVHFIPGSNFAYWGAATQELQRLGIECIYHPFYSNLDMFLDDRGDMFDYVIVSRAECADLFIDKIKQRLPSAKIIYNTVDMHFLRMQREAETLENETIAAAAEKMRARELSYINSSDATIILSSIEYELLANLGVPEEKLWLIPLIRPRSERLVEYGSTKDMLFIGGYKHPPNVDAVEWLVHEIWPHIEQALPGVHLRICGSSMPERFQTYASDSIIIQGFVPDLDSLLSKTRLTLAPLRFGAGLKGKVASSIGVGVPVVGTSIAFEGMAENGLTDVILQADDPKEFAELAVKAYKDESIWEGISFSGVEYHNANYAYQNVATNYAAMLAWTKEGTAAAVD